MDEHEHTEACGSTPETESLLAKLNDPGQKLTESQFRELRGKYFTVRHLRVRECWHLLDQINEPTFRNCEYCWFAFFSSHGELVNVTDEAFKEHGAAFVDRLRGRKYRKMFTSYMSTLAAFKVEADAMQAAKEAQPSAQSSPRTCLCGMILTELEYQNGVCPRCVKAESDRSGSSPLLV